MKLILFQPPLGRTSKAIYPNMLQEGTPLRRSARLVTVSATKDEIGAETSAQSHLKRKRVAKSQVVNANESVSGSDGASSEESLTKQPAKKRKKTTTKSLETTVSKEVLAKPKRQRKPKPEPLYIIPDVEKKESTFRGRLGTHTILVHEHLC